MYTFTTVTEANEVAEAADAALAIAEMQYDVAVIVKATPEFITECERELAAAHTAYHEAMEDLTDTENAQRHMA